MKYEITHDNIAYQVFRKSSETQRRRARVKKLVEERLVFYKDAALTTPDALPVDGDRLARDVARKRPWAATRSCPSFATCEWTTVCSTSVLVEAVFPANDLAKNCCR